ncbi:hypothetical protein [Propionibacterium australiense]|uniref:Suppressor of fused protein (SUFU) n=1 Tax=Propionibacterium australiense TaxID=119981 RepID=A0A383S842_9ACTN|nr:hypothetical protein [Propionibacterium australiense]RLP09006.1 hypothetical protein D9T14_07805 [Propionibacterium australiense]RLP09060.1 hypothetical protein D7U36_07940 [Propionibacterium australiense]SYZ33426.1 Hypothetical protein PROPAUS_1345 [Propionibacterium australiense]VEH91869.1 Uncharacterised protein [Propionibacterium australiense]
MHDIALTPTGRESLETMHRRIVQLGLLDDRPERVGWISCEAGTCTGTVLTDEEELRGGPLRYRTHSAVGLASLPDGYYTMRITRRGLHIQQWDAEDHLRRALQVVREAGRGSYAVCFVSAVDGDAAQPLGNGFKDMPVESIAHLRRLRALAADPPRVFVVEARMLRTRLITDKPIGDLPVSVDTSLVALYQQEFTGVDAVRRDRAAFYSGSGLEPLGAARFDDRWPRLSRNTWPAGPELWQLFGAPDGTTIILSEGLADPNPDDGLRVELFAEADARITPGSELEDYWIFHTLRRVANFAINGGLVYERITRRGFFVMQLTDGPDELRGPDGRVNVLLGAPSEWIAGEQVWGALEVALVSVTLIDPQLVAELQAGESRDAAWQELLETGRPALGNNALRVSGQTPRPAHD